MTDDYSGDLDHPDDEELEELEPYEEILDEWMDLGWFDLLPAGLVTISMSFVDVTTARLDFDVATAEAVATGELQLLDDDPLWPVVSPEQAADDGIADPDEYSTYLEQMLAQRARWTELGLRNPDFAITSVNALVDLLIGWGLLLEQDGLLELVDEVPDPLDLLPLDEETIAGIILDRMGPEIEAVEDVLHEFLHHSDEDTLATTLDKLAQQADVSADVARIAVAMLISHPDTGLTADRFGPLDAEGIESLKEHQKFTLRVDRTAPGLSEHAH
jgi:hypothetical protein